MGPGDELFIKFLSNPEFSKGMKIISDGSISLPIIGTININGLSIYFNPIEKSYKKFLGKKNIGIRPLYGGKLTSKYTFNELIKFSLKEKKITKIILSINKIKNFKYFYNLLNA